jgi:hypothetical protein
MKNKGLIRFNSLDAAKFFLRAFNLESELELALEKFKLTPKSHDRIAFPIISEYDVDKDLKFVFVLFIMIDPIGLSDGTGVVYFASPDDPDGLAEITKHRDELADRLIEQLREGGKTRGMVVMETGKERGRV